MNANAAAILDIFQSKARLEVPLFQRQYVWNQTKQWEPLWEDISRKFNEHLEGRQDAPIHFLGAMVLDQKLTPTTHVPRRQVIDGQQRLTTLQIFLAAFRDTCTAIKCGDLAEECTKYLLNTGMMNDRAVEQFKVWPTQSDREQFSAVITSGSRAILEKQYPLTRRKYARAYDPRPLMVEAYLYFHQALLDYFVGTTNDPPLSAKTPVAERLLLCFTALKGSLKVVIIDLERDDDAQVIFETLNARGEPLLPADLLRNYIFLRAAREGANAEDLYNQYWKSFDDLSGAPKHDKDGSCGRVATSSYNTSSLVNKDSTSPSNTSSLNTKHGSNDRNPTRPSKQSYKPSHDKEHTSDASPCRRRATRSTRSQLSLRPSTRARPTRFCFTCSTAT